MAHRQNSAPPDDEGRARRALRDLREPFAAWITEASQEHDHEGHDHGDHGHGDHGHEGHDHEPVDAQELVEVLTLSLARVLRLRASPHKPVATRFTPAEVERLVADPPPPIFEGITDEEAQQAILAVWQDFLEFLGDTDRWTGSPQELDECLDVLEDATGADDVLRALLLAAEEVSAQEEDATVLASFPVRAATALLDHVGAGVEVTATGDLPAEDVARTVTSLGLPLPAAADGGQVQAGDVPWLRHLWTLLVDLGLLQVSAADGRARPTETAARWLAADDLGRRVRRGVVGFFALDDPAALDDEEESPVELAMPSVLAAIVTGAEVTPQWLAQSLAGPLEDLVGAEAAGAAVGQVVERLRTLAGHGIVSASTPWTVERGYWPAVAAAVEESLSDEDDHEH